MTRTERTQKAMDSRLDKSGDLLIKHFAKANPNMSTAEIAKYWGRSERWMAECLRRVGQARPVGPPKKL